MTEQLLYRANVVPVFKHVRREAVSHRVRADALEDAGRRAAIAKAVEAERSRIAGDRTQTAEPLTELGRDVKKQTDIPTILVDRIVRHVATTKLKAFSRRGKPS